MRTLAFLFLTFLYIPLYVSSQASKADDIVSKWADQKILRNAIVVVYFQDAATGKSIGEHNADLCVAPASTLKLWSTATALEILSPNYRFSTKLAYSGTIKNDTLHGDLIIIGGGDPVLGSRYFEDHYLNPHFINNWIDTLKSKGIKHINGNLIANASAYNEPIIPDRWSWDDIGNYYGALPSGLSVYDNTLEIHFSSPKEAGKLTHIIFTKPNMPELQFDNRVFSSDINIDMAYVYGSPFDDKRFIKGTIPKNRTDFIVKGVMPNPPLVLINQFRDSLDTHNITVQGKVFEAQTHHDKELTSILSPTLLEIIKETNHESINLFADHMVQHLAYIKNGKGNFEDGINLMIDFWESKDIDTYGLYLCDGSGLSRFNAVSGRQMVSMLAYMKNKSSYSDLYFSTLPSPPDGTLASFNPKLFPGKSLKAKSGTIGRVRCFAGLLRTKSGKEILFNIALNNYSCPSTTATKAIEKLLSDMYNEF